MSTQDSIKKLGFGLMRLPMKDGKVDMEQTKQMVDLFMSRGFSYFDTAYGYINETSEGAAKEALVDRSPRESFQLATKMPAFSGVDTPEEAQAMFWTSLKRAGVDYFDYYLLHNLGFERTAVFEALGVWEFVAQQKAEGRIRHIGFSMHATASHLDEVLQKHPETDFVQLQINYADWENSIIQSRKCYEVARKHGKPVIIMEPVKGGALARLPKEAAELLEQAAPGASQASWAIRYAASLEGVLTVLSGMSTLEQMEDNVAFMENLKPMTPAEYEAISHVQAILAQTPQVPCTDCKYCLKDCPQRIAIPGIFKVYNDYLRYGDYDMVKGSYEWETSTREKAASCIACGLCEGVCPQSIPIIDELKKASAVFDR